MDKLLFSKGQSSFRCHQESCLASRTTPGLLSQLHFLVLTLVSVHVNSSPTLFLTLTFSQSQGQLFQPKVDHWSLFDVSP